VDNDNDRSDDVLKKTHLFNGGYIKEQQLLYCKVRWLIMKIDKVEQTDHLFIPPKNKNERTDIPAYDTLEAQQQAKPTQ
jgi:hypothetical protein